jgi:hypothetical protein
MKTFPVSVICNVIAEVLEQPFRYRVYVNDELFTERTWIWPSSVYLEEMLPIFAPAGRYTIRFETVDPSHGRLKTHNHRIEEGAGQITTHQGDTVLEIADASK